MRVPLAHVAAVLALAVPAAAQRPASPRETVTATVGGKKVEVEYGRPSLKERKLEELIAQLPGDRIWRAGDNEVTTFTTEGPLLVDGKKVPAGKYSLYVHAPEDGAWSVVLNKDPGIALGKLWAQAPPERASRPWPRLDGYEKVLDQEVARVAMKPGENAAPVETFSIALTPTGNGATMSLAWGQKLWSVELKPAR
jgi:hypothetical protein